jgi:hypothetical protein
VEKGGCESCHQLSSFADVKFDHDRDSKFPLTGKHRATACASCHTEQEVNGARAVRYRPMQTSCATCHLDVHAGQFVDNSGQTACGRCHTTEKFDVGRFVHAAPFTNFALEGKHAQVTCDKCHPAVEVSAKVRLTKYKPIPSACSLCHADFHRGEFKGFSL